MHPTLIFCIIAYCIVTHQSPQSDSTARTWLRYILFLAPIAQAINLYTAGTAAFIISFLVGLFAAYLTAGSDDDTWINGMFASSQFLCSYCIALFNFMPMFQGIRDQLSD